MRVRAHSTQSMTNQPTGSTRRSPGRTHRQGLSNQRNPCGSMRDPDLGGKLTNPSAQCRSVWLDARSMGRVHAARRRCAKIDALFALLPNAPEMIMLSRGRKTSTTKYPRARLRLHQALGNALVPGRFQHQCVVSAHRLAVATESVCFFGAYV